MSFKNDFFMRKTSSDIKHLTKGSLQTLKSCLFNAESSFQPWNCCFCTALLVCAALTVVQLWTYHRQLQLIVQPSDQGIWNSFMAYLHETQLLIA